MKEPIYWKPPESQHAPEVRPRAPKVGFWNSAKNTLWFFVWLGSLLLFGLISARLGWAAVIVVGIPYYIFTGWIARKIFTDQAGWSTSQTGFSLRRIIIGVVTLSALLLSALIGAGIVTWK